MGSVQVRESRKDAAIGWGLAIVAFCLLFATERNVGFVRDESIYFLAGESYGRWVVELFRHPAAAISDGFIVQAFGINSEHPVLMKILFGLSYLLFHETLGWLRPAAAFRVPAFAMAALILTLTYFLARMRLRRLASVFAALTWVAIPRQFFNSHLACFDVPIATLWVLTVYCYVQSFERPRFWVYTGLAFAAAISTKHNGYFLPLTIVPFALARAWLASRESLTARRLVVGVIEAFAATLAIGAVVVTFAMVRQRTGMNEFIRNSTGPSTLLIVAVAGLAVCAWLLYRLRTVDMASFRALAPLAAMAILGPAIFYLHWPYLWHHPMIRANEYAVFHLTHVHYPWFYLGDLLRAPPFPLAYVVVVTALTVPTSIFTLMVFGVAGAVASLVQRKWDWFYAICLLNAAVPIIVISFPSVPHFGGVKHWFPAMPFLGVLAAASLERGGAALAAVLAKFPRIARAAPAALGLLVLAPAAVATARVYQYGTSAYSELAGGLPGAATLGMQRQFWANNVTGVLPWINGNARPGERVYLHENHGYQVRDYVRNGMLRADLRMVGSTNEADIVAYQYHQEFREAEFNIWDVFRTTKPVYGLYIDETPQVVVYRRTP